MGDAVAYQKEVLSSVEIEVLCRSFQGGSEIALTRLYYQFRDDILRFLNFLTRDEHQAVELSQQVWIRVLEKKDSLKNPAKFKNWLFRMAHRHFLMSLRESNVNEELSDEIVSEEIQPIDLMINEETKDHVFKVIETHPADRREILWLVVVEECSHQEVARILDIPEGTARSRLHYTLKELRKKLSSENL